jgi:hypothetical protein
LHLIHGGREPKIPDTEADTDPLLPGFLLARQPSRVFHALSLELEQKIER